MVNGNGIFRKFIIVLKSIKDSFPEFGINALLEKNILTEVSFAGLVSEVEK